MLKQEEKLTKKRNNKKKEVTKTNTITLKWP